VRTFVDKYEKEDGQPLDILIESAGLLTFAIDFTEDKQERTCVNPTCFPAYLRLTNHPTEACK
jgi:hypothetical protein